MRNLLSFFKRSKMNKRIIDNSEDMNQRDDVVLISDVDNADYLKEYKNIFSDGERVRIKVLGGCGGGVDDPDAPVFINWSMIFFSMVINIASSYVYKFLGNLKNNKNNIQGETVKLIQEIKIYDHTGWPTVCLRFNMKTKENEYSEIEFFIPGELAEEEIIEAINKIPITFRNKLKTRMRTKNTKFFYMKEYKDWTEIYA